MCTSIANSKPGRLTIQHSKQHGSAMLMALLILIVLTLLAVFSSSSGIMQERMTGNYTDSARAFEAAEAAIAWAEGYLSDPTTTQPFTCTPAQCQTGENIIREIGSVSGDINTLTKTWWTGNGLRYGDVPGVTTPTPATLTSGTVDATLPGITTTPRIMIERVFCQDDVASGPRCSGPGIHFYRITAFATGGIASNTVILESTFSRRFR